MSVSTVPAPADPVASTGAVPASGLSRRSFLKASAAGAAALGALPVLSACGSSGGGSDNITLKMAKTGYYGFWGAMPTAAEQKNNPTNVAYAEALNKWLKKNPGVKLQAVNVDIYDQNAITTAIAGRTAPAIFSGQALGNFTMPATYLAFQQGLAADVTDLVEKAGLVDKLASYSKPLWESSFHIAGKYYGVPQDYGPGDGMLYRRDLFAAAGLEEPKATWTWSDVRSMCKQLTRGGMKGFAFPQWQMPFNLSTAGLDVFYEIPEPKSQWHWKFDYTSMLERYESVVSDLRAMLHTEKTAISDVSYNKWDPIQAAFLQGKVAMRPGNLSAYLADPSSADSPMAIAKKLGKQLDEVVGWMSYPVDTTGYVPAGGGQGSVGCTSFSPDLNKKSLAKAFSLTTYLTGDGTAEMANSIYDSTKNLRLVWTQATLRPVYAATAAKMPGSAEQAWGKNFNASVDACTSRPLTPASTSYLPPEKTAGPVLGDAPSNDAFNKLTYEKSVNVADVFTQLAKTQNQQAKSFTSTADSDAFRDGAKKYYAALSDYAQEHCPDFKSQYLQPWYDSKVASNLGS